MLLSFCDLGLRTLARRSSCRCQATPSGHVPGGVYAQALWCGSLGSVAFSGWAESPRRVAGHACASMTSRL